MPEAGVIVLLIAFPLVGLLVRRWATVVLPLIAWPVFYAGLDQGWWGDGTGDGWQYAAALLTVIGVASTALAVGIAAGAWSLRAHRPKTS
jgi:hypothetical protein